MAKARTLRGPIKAFGLAGPIKAFELAGGEAPDYTGEVESIAPTTGSVQSCSPDLRNYTPIGTRMIIWAVAPFYGHSNKNYRIENNRSGASETFETCNATLNEANRFWVDDDRNPTEFRRRTWFQTYGPAGNQDVIWFDLTSENTGWTPDWQIGDPISVFVL